MFSFWLSLPIFAILNNAFVESAAKGYYWREYTGKIPEDALIGGQDINSKNIYIGQAYVNNQGLIVSEIFPDVKTVNAPFYGVKKIDSYTKILCGDKQNFYWAPANKTDLHLQLINKMPVIGGHEPGGILYIGRMHFQGGVKIGKIVSFDNEAAYMYFVHKDNELTSGSYEILLYNNDSSLVTCM